MSVSISKAKVLSRIKAFAWSLGSWETQQDDMPEWHLAHNPHLLIFVFCIFIVVKTPSHLLLHYIVAWWIWSYYWVVWLGLGCPPFWESFILTRFWEGYVGKDLWCNGVFCDPLEPSNLRKLLWFFRIDSIRTFVFGDFQVLYKIFIGIDGQSFCFQSCNPFVF